MSDPFVLTVDAPGEPDVDAALLEDPAELGQLGAGIEDDGLAPIVTEDQVRRALVTLGTGAGQWVGDPDVPDHWAFTPAELDALAPALTAYVNRHGRLRAAMARSDELTIAAVLAGYGWRNVADGRRAARARADDGEPIDRWDVTDDGLSREAPMDAGPAGPADPFVDLFGGPAPTATGPGSFAPDRSSGDDGG